MPRKMDIRGSERSLDETIEGIITLNGVIEKNRYDYRQAWSTWLPSEKDKPNTVKMAYVPVVCMRKCYPAHQSFSGKIRDIPYFIFILNQSRENRPKSKKKSKGCKICENILDRGMIISDIDDYHLTPNGFPYHMRASLLVHKDRGKKQGEITENDIATWMKASILLDQYVFFNTMSAGASIKEHQHAQVVDPSEIRIDNEITQYPVLNPAFVGRERVNGREDVFRLTNYPVDALIFIGRDAPHKASYAAHLIKSQGHAYNILVNKNEVFVIGRNPEREVSICIQRKVGGYEISGVALLGDIEERVSGLKVRVEGAKIFTNMTHEIFSKNIAAAATKLDGIAKHF